ncbi:hypothetical protein MPC1_17730002 [Methylocella tundrae]|nr:hypothetical protein MPC1_17730002 [Methylocella tundrae]
MQKQKRIFPVLIVLTSLLKVHG